MNKVYTAWRTEKAIKTNKSVRDLSRAVRPEGAEIAEEGRRGRERGSRGGAEIAKKREGEEEEVHAEALSTQRSRRREEDFLGLRLPMVDGQKQGEDSSRVC